MEKVPLQNNKNWASSKCLVRKSEKMYLSQNLGMWNPKKWHFLCSYVPEFHRYISTQGNNTFPGS